MLWIVIHYLLIASFSYQAACRPAKNLTGATFQTKAFPNPLVVPWGNAHYYCTNNIRWMTKDWNSSDCVNAIQKFHDVEVTPKRGTIYEFVEAGGRQRHAAYYGQETPREYTSGRQCGCSGSPVATILMLLGSCTMGIVSLNDRSVANVSQGALRFRTHP